MNEIVRILSRRAKAILAQPQHLKYRGEDLLWDFTFEKGSRSNLLDDKILTLFYQDQQNSELEVLFMESLARLSVAKKAHFLFKLSFREVENYLRDENHLPLFLPEDQKMAEIIFNDVKKSLLVELILAKLGPKDQLQWGWADGPLVFKNKKVKEILSRINSCIGSEGAIQLALAEENCISVLMDNEPIDQSVLEAVLIKWFSSNDFIPSFKLKVVQ